MKNLFRILVLTAFAACLATGSFAAGPLSQGKQKRSAPQVAVGDFNRDSLEVVKIERAPRGSNFLIIITTIKNGRSSTIAVSEKTKFTAHNDAGQRRPITRRQALDRLKVGSLISVRGKTTTNGIIAILIGL